MFAGDRQVKNETNALTEMLLDTLEKNELQVHPHPHEGFPGPLQFASC